MRNLLTTVFLLLGLVLAAQGETILTRYTMAVSFADVTSLTTTTHRATLNAQSDQLGEGYLANQIQVGYRVLTSTKRHFEVITIDNSSFGSATVVLTEIGATTLGPNGSGVLYDPGANGMIPPLPANATGVSQALLANMLIHNFEVAQTLAGGTTTVETAGDIDGNGSPENPVSYVRPIPTWAEITGKPTTFPSGDDVVGNEDNGLVLFEGKIFTTKANGNRIGSGVTPPPGEVVDQLQTLRLNPDGRILYIVNPDGTDYSFVTLNNGLTRYDRTVGGLRAETYIFGTNQPGFSGDAASGYDYNLSNGDFKKMEFTGSSTTSNAAGELVIRFVFPPSEGQFLQYQLYDLTNNQKVDVHLTGNVAKQEITGGNTTTLTIPNIGGNYPNGFRLILN